MPARKSTKTAAAAAAEPVASAPTKRTYKRKAKEAVAPGPEPQPTIIPEVMNEKHTSDSAFFQVGYDQGADVSKNVDAMERVKSKIEGFDKASQTKLLRSILTDYYAKLNQDQSTTVTASEVWERFKAQISENQNGIFVNLTKCDKKLWESCVRCVQNVEKQEDVLIKLEQERAAQVAQIKSVMAAE